MIKVLEKNYLEDEFIIKALLTDISIKNNLSLKKEDIYYFGNYKDDFLDNIKKKINKNKKRIKNAVEKGTTIILHGNSVEIFNNSFKPKDINLFTAYKTKKKKTALQVNDLNKGISSLNFRYKNLICID